jgi:hypothetical protein
MTLDEADWILERTKTIGQRHWFRDGSWPVDHWISFQRIGSPDGMWTVWRSVSGIAELFADGINDPVELFLELENAWAEWPSVDDCGSPTITLEAVSATMAAEILDGALLTGDRIGEALAIKCGRRAAGREDAVLSAQIAWHRTPAIFKLMAWQIAPKLHRVSAPIPPV